MKRSIASVFILLSFFASRAWAEAEWLSYDSKPVEGTSYSVQYPADWELKELSPASVAFVSPEGFFTSVTVSMQNLRREGQETPTLEQYIDGYDGMVGKYLGSYKRLERAPETLSGLPAFVTRFSATDRKDPKWQMETRVYTLITPNAQAVDVAYTSTPASYGTFVDTADRIMKSFELKK